MTLKRIPVIPTLLVFAAVAVMVRLGFWQLDRMHQKEAMLARYHQAIALSAETALPADPAARAAVYFRRTSVACAGQGQTRPMAGHNRRGETGWAQWAACTAPGGRTVADVNAGWSRGTAPVPFAGGVIRGVIAPDGPGGARVVAVQPQAGLEPGALPDPNAIPNNHWSYAIQWFLFAATALIIYALALRKRLAA